MPSSLNLYVALYGGYEVQYELWIMMEKVAGTWRMSKWKVEN